MKLLKTEYAPFYEVYVSKTLALNKGIIESLEVSSKLFFTVLSDLPKEKELFAYQENKWTIKELVSHIIDTERIMAYRALRISRNDKVDLLSFNENDFVLNSNANEIPFKELLNEFSLVRASTIAMYKNFNEELLSRVGKASGANLSVNALGYILSGHVLHHLMIILYSPGIG
jgi:hypothetical protein